jgi:hypothetical protein
MSCRRLLALASSSLALLLLAPTAKTVAAAAAPAAAGPARWIAVAPITSDAQVQQLTRMVDTRGRYGDLALVLGDQGAEAALKKSWPQTTTLGPELAGEALFVVALLPGEQLPPRPGVRVLLQSPRQAILGVAADAGIELHELLPPANHPGGRAFHDGVAPVPTHAMRPARGSRHVPGGGFGTRAGPTADPRVSAIVGSVVQANIDADVNYYSNTFYTRRADQPDGVNAQNDLLARFQALGLAASLFDFGSGSDDVIAEIPGALEPDKVVIVGAHYDSINYAGPTSRSPGADDNGSGTASVLELARAFAASGQPFRYTLRFCLFSSEELGLVGSAAYATDLSSNDVEVVAMLNVDMDAYLKSGDTLDLDFADNDTTSWLTNDLIALSQLYVPTLPVVTGTLTAGTSDHRSFFNEGYPAAFFFEDLTDYSHFLHTDQDTYGQSANDFGLAALIVQSIAAGLATYAEPLDLVLAHAPLGDSADSWNPSSSARR